MLQGAPISPDLSLLSELETRFEVWSWQFEGLHYWPIARAALRTHLVRGLSAVPGLQSAPAARPASSVANSPAAVMSADELRRFWASKFDWAQERVDLLFLSRQEDNHDLVGDLAHDRMVDPLYRLAEGAGYRVAKVRIDRGVAPPFDRLAVAAQAFNPNSSPDLDLKVPALAGVDEVLGELARRGLTFEGGSAIIRSTIKRTLHREIAFGALLDRCKPRAVVLGVFDDPVQMSAILACGRRNIRSIDVQHGKQGLDHLLCIKWQNIPMTGSDLLPDRFWTWGEPTARRVNAALAPATKVHRAIVGGNAWLAEWRSGAHGRLDTARHFASRFADAARRLLVCLQPISDPVPPTLREAMARAPNDWVWWVRLHRKQRHLRDDIVRILETTGARFEIDEPTALPLYPLLMQSDFQLTGWSTVAFEAEAFDVPTVLFHPFGETVFAEEIGEGRFVFAANGDSLIQAIKNARSRPARGRLAKYVHSDIAASRRALGRLVPSRAYASLAALWRRMFSDAKPTGVDGA